MSRTMLAGAAAAAVILLNPAPSTADPSAQLAASAGVSASEASQMSLSELYARKINREAGRDNRVTVSTRGTPAGPEVHSTLVANAGLDEADARGMSLNEVAAHKHNRNATRDAQVAWVEHGVASDPSGHPQLLAQAWIDGAEADGMTLADLHEAKLNREARRDDRIGAAR